ncbi:MAG: ribulose-phosphate 3-epimerase, partial [Defluviitaleaceae bacterium]|nr:ribulose-phosphate 3-epimerase [Defluviitaleaceae bacterium]
MMGAIKIHPSILCANHGSLAQEISAVTEAGADYMHIDVMDGVFVPNYGCGTEIMKCVKKHTHLPIDAHLMVVNPASHIRLFCDLGADIITIHPEVDNHAPRTLAEIKAMGAIPGIAINPGTSVETIKELLPLCGHVLAMTVNPGFGGQSFLDFTLGKIETLGGLAKEHGFTLCLDGGVSENNIKKLAHIGATSFVVGSALFGQEDYKEAIYNL